MRELSFWERLVSQTLCQFARKAASQWIHLSTELSAKQRHRLFGMQIERGDPASESPTGLESSHIRYGSPEQHVPPHQRGEDPTCTHYLRFLIHIFSASHTLSAQKKDGEHIIAYRRHHHTTISDIYSNARNCQHRPINDTTPTGSHSHSTTSKPPFYRTRCNSLHNMTPSCSFTLR